jgi:hypothetical protein
MPTGGSPVAPAYLIGILRRIVKWNAGGSSPEIVPEAALPDQLAAENRRDGNPRG